MAKKKKEIYYSLLADINYRLSNNPGIHKSVLIFYRVIYHATQKELEDLITSEIGLEKYVKKNRKHIISEQKEKTLDLIAHCQKAIRVALPFPKEREKFSHAHFILEPLLLMNIEPFYMEKLISSEQIFKTWHCLWSTKLMQEFENHELDEYGKCWKNILSKKNKKLIIDHYVKTYKVSRKDAASDIKIYALIEKQVVNRYIKEKLNCIEKNIPTVCGFRIRLEKVKERKSWKAYKAYGTGELNVKFVIYICSYSKLPTESRVKKKIAEYFSKKGNSKKFLTLGIVDENLHTKIQKLIKEYGLD